VRRPWDSHLSVAAKPFGIEMAFGMMQKKWGILWRPLVVPFKKIKYIVEVIGCLHNYCIKERLLESGG
jgi:hypothetical protein